MKTLLLDATANFASVPGSGSGAVDDIFVFTNFNQGNVLAFTALTCQGITTIRRHNRAESSHTLNFAGMAQRAL
jgi:hypothetical protein